MSFQNGRQHASKTVLLKWLPAIITAIAIFIVPPAAIAVIIAYFTAPLLYAVRSVTRLPLTIATIVVMALMLLLSGSFIYIALHGIIDILPAIERHLSPYTKNTDIIGKLLSFLESKIVQFGQMIIEYGVMIIRSVFQHLFSLFIFLVAYFFALRESGKYRYWFLVYFPTKMRNSAKKMLSGAGKLVGTYVSVEVKLIFITFIILSIGFSFLQFGSPIGTAFLISLVDSIPFLGIGLFMIPMAIFFIHAGNVFIGISLILLFIFTMTTRQLAESYLWASTFQLKPIHTFFIMAGAFYLLGFIGILLTPFLLYAASKVKNHRLFTS